MKGFEGRRFIVTGGAGFIGKRLSGFLVDAGAAVTVVDSGVTGRLEDVPTGCEIIDRDIVHISIDEWRELLDGTAGLFHLAAVKHNTPRLDDEILFNTNVVSTRTLAKACAASRVRLIFASSLYAYGYMGPDAMTESQVPLPVTSYGATKLMGEILLRAEAAEQSLDWVAARLFFIYGPGQFAEGGYKSVIVKSIDRLLKGEPVVVNGDGNQALDYVYVDDAVDALMRLADLRELNGAGPFNVASGKPRSVNAIMEGLEDVVGSSIERASGPADWTAGSRRWGSYEAIHQATGWAPSTHLQDGLREVWAERVQLGAKA